MSMISFVFITACEKSAIRDEQAILLIDDQPMELRTDCVDCPANDCCCAIILQDQVSGTARLRLCGTSDGIGSCSEPAVGSCPAFSGGGQLAPQMDSNYPRHGFCMNPGDSFSITNVGFFDALIYLTCTSDSGSPQTLTITIPSNATYYYDTTGGCIVSGC